MFSDISIKIKKRMQYLEKMDAKDRKDETPRLKRLRQIPPETGKFIALIASNCPEGNYIEIGTSAGYSTLWLSLAAREKNIKIKTFEILPEKIKLAEETFQISEVENYIELIKGDALDYIHNISDIAFCFLDAEKEIYEKCWDIISLKMISGGFFTADNAINRYEKIKHMIEKVENNKYFDSLIVPIGTGVLISRRR